MELTNYSIEDLKLFSLAIANYREAVKSADEFLRTTSSKEIMALLHFENDIEQAIKDIQFEQERKDNLPIEP